MILSNIELLLFATEQGSKLFTHIISSQNTMRSALCLPPFYIETEAERSRNSPKVTLDKEVGREHKQSDNVP